MNVQSVRYQTRTYLLLVLLAFCLLKALTVVISSDSTEYVSYSEYNYPLEMNFTEIGMKEQQPPPEVINPHPFQYIHFKKKCHFKEGRKTSLLVLVKSSSSNFHLREAIRKTWGKLTEEDNVEILYLLAYRADQQWDVDQEAAIYGDIVQENFADSYMNNTYKTIMGFNWANNYCDQATHVIFVDDDHYLHLPTVLNYIEKVGISSGDDLMIGNLVSNGVPYRDKSSKWHLSFEQYPFDRLPLYLAGAAFLMTRETVRKMSVAFPHVKYMGIDDLYLGIVARKVRIELRHERTFVIPHYLMHTDPSQMVYGEFKQLEAFKIVHRFLKYSQTVKMCAFTWKCQFAFLV